MRRLTRFGAAVALALAPVLLVTTPAQAAGGVIAPDIPPPLNLPASALKGYSTGDLMMTFLYKSAQTPEFWQAVAARDAGQTLTAGQLEVIEQGKANTRIPTGGTLAKLAKGPNVMGAYEVGTMIGGGVLGLFGIDGNGAVCENTGYDAAGIAAKLLSGQDCTGHLLERAPEFQPNTDVGASIPQGWNPTNVWAGGDPPTKVALNVTVSGTEAAGQVGTVQGTYTQFGTTGITLPNDGHCKNLGTLQITSRAVAFYSDMDGKNWGSIGSSTEWKNRYAAGERSATGTWTCPAGSVVYSFNDAAASGGGFARQDVSPGWFSAFSPRYLPGTSGNPRRSMRCKVTGTDGNTYLGAAGTQFTETDPVFAPPACPATPPGVHPGKVEILETSPTGGEAPVYEMETSPEFRTFAATHAECMDGTCALYLFAVNPDGTLTNCHFEPGKCADWSTNPNRETLFQCQYGGKVVALSECNAYAPTFNPQKRDVEGPYADPDAQPAPPPADAPAPGGGSYPGSIADPASQRQCWPSGWGVFNPFEWMLRPIQCGLEWAFVPRTGVLETQLGDVETAWNGTPFGKLIPVVAGWEFEPVMTGCGGYPYSFPIGETVFEGTLLNACEAPLDTVAAWAKGISTVAVIVATLIGVTRYIAAAFGFVGFADAGPNS